MNRVVLLVGALMLTAAGCAGSSSDEPVGGAVPTSAGPGTGSTTRTSEMSETTGTSRSSETSETAETSQTPTPTSSRPMSTTVLPTIQPPTAPPSLPSDQLAGLWVTGTVTAGTVDRCATLTADDGRVLVLSGGVALTEGDAVKVRIVQPPRPVWCGDVEAWTLLEVAPAS